MALAAQLYNEVVTSKIGHKLRDLLVLGSKLV